MNNRIRVTLLSAVLIAAVVSGCVQETSEIGTPGEVPQSNVTPPAATPDAVQPEPASEVTSFSASAGPEIRNWKYVSYRNLSISNAPALNQTARVTYSIIPDRDIEDLLVYVSFLDGFEFVDVEGERLLTWGKDKTPYRNLERSAKWRPTDILKGEMYQFNVTIKAVKTGNWTITGRDWEDAVYVSVSEDSAYISDEPFPYIPMFISRSQFEKELAEQNMTLPPPRPSKYNLTPRPLNISDVKGRPPQDFHLSNFYWNGTTWVEGKNPVMGNQS